MLEYDEICRAAMGFVLEADRWEQFLVWAKLCKLDGHGNDWVERPITIDEARLLWLENSRNPLIKAIGEEVRKDDTANS
jgi:hypothetical protein